MFTGIIEDLGEVVETGLNANLCRLVVKAQVLAAGVAVGDSVSLNGVCLTAVAIEDGCVTTEIIPETLRRTNLGALTEGDQVNVERSLRADGRFGGHIVQGHVDGQCGLTARQPDGASELLTFDLPPAHAAHVVAKGFVALDGVSLTVVDVGSTEFRIALIPHTSIQVTLGAAAEGYCANLEVDVLAKYVERIMSSSRQAGDVTRAHLKAAGFLGTQNFV